MASRPVQSPLDQPDRAGDKVCLPDGSLGSGIRVIQKAGPQNSIQYNAYKCKLTCRKILSHLLVGQLRHNITKNYHSPLVDPKITLSTKSLLSFVL